MSLQLHHVPVLLKETIEALKIQPGGHYIDCTVGEGGHALAILEKISPGGHLLGIDADPQAINAANTRLQQFKPSVSLANANFADLENICLKYSLPPVDGILFDLGISSLQLESKERGFSFQYDAPLDMRFNPIQGISAAELINTLPEAEIADLIERYGEDHRSRQVAKHIVANRPVNTTHQLAQLIRKAVGDKRGRINPATKTFQALRISVNQELENIKTALRQAINLLKSAGRLVIISYHSLEDRLAKEFFRQESKGCLCPQDVLTCVCGHSATLKIITKKVIKPSVEEIKANRRSRSAKMRVVEHV